MVRTLLLDSLLGCCLLLTGCTFVAAAGAVGGGGCGVVVVVVVGGGAGVGAGGGDGGRDRDSLVKCVRRLLPHAA